MAHTLTEFLQHSGRILPEVERGEIVLRRRGGDELVIVAQEHWRALGDTLRALAEARRVQQRGDSEQGEQRTEWFALPWMSLLRADDQRACIDELSGTALAALDTSRLPALAETLARWRATALATWDDDRRRDEAGYGADEPFALSRP